MDFSNFFSLRNKLIFLMASPTLFVGAAVFSNQFFETQALTEKTIILDNNGQKSLRITNLATISEFLNSQQISLNKDDEIFPPLESPLDKETKISIKRAVYTVIKADNKEIALMADTDVKKALQKAEIILDAEDIVEPPLETALEENMIIEITRVKKERIALEETIKFKTIEKENPDLAWGQKTILQAGKNGSQKTTYEIIYTNSKQTSKKKISSEIISEPIDEIISKGTKINISQSITGLASWYAHTGTLACASLQHPKGTWLKVTNLANNKEVIVKVNDSGPYIPNRIIDLDKVAFQKIASLSQGVINVKVEKIEN